MARTRRRHDEKRAGGIRGCDYVSVPVDRFDDAAKFYRDVLGLRPSYILPDRWAEFDAGEIALSIYPREPEEGRGGDIGLSVDDLDVEKTRLESRGVQFPHGIEKFDVPVGRGRLARFRDPSGNRLELIEWRESVGRDRSNR